MSTTCTGSSFKLHMFSVCSDTFHNFSFDSVYVQADMAGIFLYLLCFLIVCLYLDEINAWSSAKSRFSSFAVKFHRTPDGVPLVDLYIDSLNL